MTISRTSESQQLETPSTASLEERISANLRIIKEITQNLTFHPKPPDHDPDKEILRSQILSIAYRGFSLPLMAEAMAISNIFLRTMIKEHKTLTLSQYNLILSSCRDLSESSGSSSTQPALRTPSLQATAETITLETTAIEKTEPVLSVPAKKRKTWRVTFAEQKEKPSEAGEKTRKTPRLSEKASAALELLLDTVALNRGLESPSTIPCPKKGSEPQHLCSICMLTMQLSKLSPSHLFSQLEFLLSYSSKEVLLEVLTNLIENKEVSITPNKTSFSYLELVYLVSDCKIGEVAQVPGRKHPSEEVELYRSMSCIIKGGTSNPLTRLITQIWNSDVEIRNKEAPLLIEEEDKKLTSILPSSLSPIFSSITQRRLQAKGREDRRYGLSPAFVKLLSNITMASLHAFKTSSLSSSYLTKTPSGELAVPRYVLKHICSLILAIHPFWRVEILPCTISHGPRETLSMTEESKKVIMPALKNFMHTNRINQPRMHYFEELSKKSTTTQPPSGALDPTQLRTMFTQAPESVLVSSLTEAREESEDSSVELEEVAGSSREVPQEQSRGKRTEKTHYLQALPEETDYPPAPQGELIELTETPSDPVMTPEALFFLLNVLKNKPDKGKVLIPCPNILQGSIFKHSCPLCIPARNLLTNKYSQVTKQLAELLKHTTEQQLLYALMTLFSAQALRELPKRIKLSNLELACLIRLCGIGDSICLPGKLNPGSQVPLYCSLNSVIQAGLQAPLTQAILELWDTSPSLPYPKEELLLSTSVIESDGSIQTYQHSALQELFTPIAQRFFSFLGSEWRRRKYSENMSPRHTKFLATLTIFSIRALQDSPLGTFFLQNSPQGPLFPRYVLDHVYCLILLANPAWRVVVLPSKASPDTVEELTFPLEDTYHLYSKLQKFTRTNRILMAGNTPFSTKKTIRGEEDPEQT
ncbi:hypothetical protein [Chlamydiifrater volucris]|uniref:hypothetical protein n=1 Tax=Chlamydiifrater volucris TaxID=2681470 RepID=UPI001BCCFF35|nr:hypothetical protein [Chlamydiifrater volucris]